MTELDRLVARACKWAHFGLSAQMAASALLVPEFFWSCVFAALAWVNLARFRFLSRQLRKAA